jgi:hypothetical protein
MTRIVNPHVYVDTSLGKGYVDSDTPEPYGRLRHPRYFPYVILADGTREDLPETRNLFGPLGDSAVLMIAERLWDGPAREPKGDRGDKPCTSVRCKHFGHDHD